MQNTNEVTFIEKYNPSDTNAQDLQFAQLVAQIRISDIQGTGLRSPLVGQTIAQIPGIITALASNGFYLQDPNPDSNSATSEGIFIFTGTRTFAAPIKVGDSVQVSGLVTEFQAGGVTSNNLTTTQISANRDTNEIVILSSNNAIPTTTIIGEAGRKPPTESISPDGILFYESLEGMRVTVNDPSAVSPTGNFSSNSSIWVVADKGKNATGINDRDGITISPTDFNPERIQITDDLLRIKFLDSNNRPAFTLPQVNVGFTLDDVTGVVGYSFGNYQILATETFTSMSARLQPEVTNVVGDKDRLTIASYNVENLNPFSGSRFEGFADQIIKNLKSPDIIALQEIQDNNGPIDDGTVAADQTYQSLIDAIADAGGPTYKFVNIDPRNNEDGGQPGSNIRVGYLYNPGRVSLVEGSVRRIIDPNLADGDAFAAIPIPVDTEDPIDAFRASRNPLVATFKFNGQEITTINNHLTSRSGSSPLFGDLQPARIRGLEERNAQATIIKSEVDKILATNPNANVVVLGDLNGFEFEQHLDILKGGTTPELKNLNETLPQKERYTFNFQGNSQPLDHLLVTNNLATQAQYDIVHVNTEFAGQLADHEPLVASLKLPSQLPQPPKPPKNIVLSLDGLTFRFVKSYLENGQLDANTGLGYLIKKGVFVPSIVTTPANTAPVHIAIATGSTAAHNNINNNSFHLIRSPFSENVRGFGAPIGGYDPFHPDGAHESSELTAEPLWVKLREAGKTVVAATFPGADGATVTLPGSNPSIVLQSNGIRTVDYTVPFGTGGGFGARGFGLSGADFNQNATQAVRNLLNLGVAFYGNVKVADLETISGIAGSTQGALDQEEGLVREDLANLTTISGGSTQNYDLKVAAIDTTNDNVANYDELIVYDANAGITINNAPPSTGSAFLGNGKKIAPFFLEGSRDVVGVSYLLTGLTPDLSTVHLIRTSANTIPRPANNLAAIASIDNTNNNVGFWRPQPDLNIARGTAPGLGGFSEVELEGAYATLNKAFSQYQTDIFLNAIAQKPGADLALGYLEGPDGVEHNFLLTDPRQATDRSNPNSILGGQDVGKVARYQQLVLDAYKVASDRVQQVIDSVGVDANGVPNSNIIITSDHGFAPFHTAVNIGNILINAGFDRNEVRAATGSSSVNIYINLQGREPDGTVSLSRYKVLQKQIVDTLKGLFDTNPNYVSGNAPIIGNVFQREVPDNATVADVINASGEFIGQDTGDVFAQLNLGYTFNGFQANVLRKDDSTPPQGARAFLSVPTFYGDHGYDSNLPEMKATFIAAGPDFSPTTLSNLKEIRAIDIAPTILDILDVKPASTVDGKSILAKPFTLQILHASDQEAGVPAFQDIPGFSAVMNALDGKYANSLKLTTGDGYIASPFFNASRDLYNNAITGNAADQPGIADILIANELGWDVASVGNHEFTGGASTFFSLLAPNANLVNGTNGAGIGAGGYKGALFPYLANNLDYSKSSLPSGLTVVANGGAPKPNTLTGSVVEDVNGEKIGLIGIVTPYLKSIANTERVEVTTLDPNGNEITGTSTVAVQVDSIIANITPEVQALKDKGINKIILMTHLQESRIEQALAQKLADSQLPVDILLGGGSHQLMSSGNLPLRGDETQQNTGQLLQPFPQEFTSGNNKVLFVNSAPNYRYLNQLVVTFDQNGVINNVGSDSGAYATDIAGVDRLYSEDITTLAGVKAKADPDIVKIVEGAQTFVDAIDGNIFGQANVFLNGIRGDVRVQETNLGNLAADAQDFYAEAYLKQHKDLLPGFNKIDISFLNGGSIRDFIGRSQVETPTSFQLLKLPTAPNPEVGKKEGDISQLDIANAFRFDGDLVVGTVDAVGFLKIAEHMISSVETGNGRFGQIGGFKFSFDPTKPAGNRIQSLALINPTINTSEAIVRNSELVVPTDRIFTVTTSRFSATGGDNYPLVIQNIRGLTDFAEPNSLGRADLASGRLQDAVAEYFAANYNAKKSQVPFAEADTPQAGDTRIQNLGFRSDTVLPEVTPPPEIVFGTNGNDELWAGRDFSGINSTVFAGAGNDEIDVPVGGASKGFNRIDAGSGQDVIYAGNGDRVNGGSGNDELDATDASGYRLSGGAGNDLFFLGEKGRAIGGDGNDKLYVQSGGDNLLTGGAGADQFWLLTDVAPDKANTVVDFTQGTDVLGIAGQGASVNFASLTRTGNSIALNGDVFAVLTGVNTTTLTAADFVFM